MFSKVVSDLGPLLSGATSGCNGMESVRYGGAGAGGGVGVWGGSRGRSMRCPSITFLKIVSSRDSDCEIPLCPRIIIFNTHFHRQ